jgi:hypothetical protein
VAEGEIFPGWHVYAAHCPSTLWTDGVNEVELAFDHAMSPASVIESDDQRPLGIALDWLRLVEGEDRPEGVDHTWTDPPASAVEAPEEAGASAPEVL